MRSVYLVVYIFISSDLNCRSVWITISTRKYKNEPARSPLVRVRANGERIKNNKIAGLRTWTHRLHHRVMSCVWTHSKREENWYRGILRRLPPLKADCAFVVVYLWGYYQRPTTQNRGGCARYTLVATLSHRYAKQNPFSVSSSSAASTLGKSRRFLLSSSRKIDA